jgi:hypothetical protein
MYSIAADARLFVTISQVSELHASITATTSLHTAAAATVVQQTVVVEQLNSTITSLNTQVRIPTNCSSERSTHIRPFLGKFRRTCLGRFRRTF